MSMVGCVVQRVVPSSGTLTRGRRGCPAAAGPARGVGARRAPDRWCVCRRCFPPSLPCPGPWGQQKRSEVGRGCRKGCPPAPAVVPAVPLEGPGEAEGDVGGAVLQLPPHLLAAGGADAPDGARAALDVGCHNVLVAVERDELHGDLAPGAHSSASRHGRSPSHPGAPPAPSGMERGGGLGWGWGGFTGCLSNWWVRAS